MLNPECSAFRFTDDDSCQLFDATYLYKNKVDTDPLPVYIQDNLWNQRGNKTISEKDKVQARKEFYENLLNSTIRETYVDQQLFNICWFIYL